MDSQAADDAAPSVQKLFSLLSRLEELTSGCNKGGYGCNNEEHPAPALGLLGQAQPACNPCVATPDPQVALQEGRPCREADGSTALLEGTSSQLKPSTEEAAGCSEQRQERAKEQRQQLARVPWELQQHEQAAAAAEAEGARWHEECARKQHQLQTLQAQLPPIVRKIRLLDRLVTGSAVREPQSTSRSWADAGTQTEGPGSGSAAAGTQAEVAPASVQLVLEQQGGSSTATLQQQLKQISRRVAELEEQGRRSEQEWLARLQGYEDQLKQLREELAAQRARQAQQGPAQNKSSSLDQGTEAQLGAAASGQVDVQQRQQEGGREGQEAKTCSPAADQAPAQQEPQLATMPAAASTSPSAPEQLLALGPGQQRQQRRCWDESTRRKRQRAEPASTTAALDTLGGDSRGGLHSVERTAAGVKRKAQAEQMAARAEAAQAQEVEDGELSAEAARGAQRRLEQPCVKKCKGMASGPTPAGRAIPRTVFVNSLHSKAERADLRHFFNDCREITKITIGADRKTGRPRGFAFVEFGTEAAAARAVQLNRERLLGQAVGVWPAVEPPASEPTTGRPPRVRTCLFVKGFSKHQEPKAVRVALTKAFSRYGEVVRLHVVGGDVQRLAGHAFLDLLTDSPEAVFGLNGSPCAGGSLVVECNLRPEKTSGGRGKTTGLRRRL